MPYLALSILLVVLDQWCKTAVTAALGSVGSQRPREASVASMPHGGVVMSFSFDSSHLEEAVAGGLLVTGSTDATAKVWQVASGCCHQTLRGHTGAVLCLVLDAPGRTAFTGSTPGTS